MPLAQHTRVEDTRALKADLAFRRVQIRRPVKLDLNALLVRTQEQVLQLLGNEIELSLQLSDEDCRVFGDAGQLEQIVMNLAANARDAMPEGGRLIVSTSRARVGHPCYPGGRVGAGDYVVLTVQDTGHGMDEQVKAHVFEPFFTTKPAGLGRGLGLSSVYGIVKQCGGHIGVASAPGVGSTFIIYLPLARRGGSERRAPLPSSLSRSTSSRRRQPVDVSSTQAAA